LIISYIDSLFNPTKAEDIYKGFDLSQLFAESKIRYTIAVIVLVIISGLKAYVFYFAIRLFKILNFAKPFSKHVSKVITKITYFTFVIGIISGMVEIIVSKISENRYNFGPVETLWSDSDAYLFMSAILFVIALIFRKGIELQTENELTV
jgi:ABC-type multidrug transport system fused ATPase/permease subunit